MITWNLGLFRQADAERVYSELNTLNEITPANVLEYAKNNQSELHKCFDWDDSIASEKWRLHQARQVINDIVVVKENDDSVKTRVFVNVERRSTVYKPLKVVLQKEDEYMKLLEQAKRDLQKFKNKYHSLKELNELFELIEKI